MSNTNLSNKNLSRGRPINPEKQVEQKNKLLDAAFELLSEKSYADITLRELATLSGVNSAMVSYYFSNKEGLFIALIDRMSKKHFLSMKEISHTKNPIKTFIVSILKILSSNGSFARLIHAEFSAKDSELSDIFIERFPKKMAVFLPQLIKKETGILDDKKAKYVAFSLINMIITPFINKSIRKDAWQITDEEIQDDFWAEHIYQQFMFGCAKSTITTHHTDLNGENHDPIEKSNIS